MPSNYFQYQGLGNWVHQKMKKKKVVTVPLRKKQNKTGKPTGLIQGEKFYIRNSTLHNGHDAR